MKVLGVKLNYYLSWSPHIKNTLQKYRRKLGILKKISNRFTKEQFLNIAMAQYYSHLYYCAPVWYNDTTSYPLKRLINTVHYRPLRISLKDHRYRLSRPQLLKICKRASPSEWVKYSLALRAIKIMNNKEPHYLFSILQETFYSTRRRPRIGNFYDTFNGKIGRQKLNCKLKCMDSIKFDWLEVDLNDNRLRILLKNTFFSYLLPDEV